MSANFDELGHLNDEDLVGDGQAIGKLFTLIGADPALKKHLNGADSTWIGISDYLDNELLIPGGWPLMTEVVALAKKKLATME